MFFRGTQRLSLASNQNNLTCSNLHALAYMFYWIAVRFCCNGYRNCAGVVRFTVNQPTILESSKKRPASWVDR
jgi:hypothetical protein